MPAETADAAVERDSIAGAKGTAVTRVTGFVRTGVIGAALGATWFGNIFQLANQLPWMLYELLLGSLLASLFVPTLVRTLEKHPDRLERLTGSLFGLVAVVFAGLSVVAAAGAPLLARIVTAGIAPEDQAHARSAATLLFVLTAPQLAGYALIATAAAVQNAKGRFGLPAAAPIVENVIVIVVVVAYWAMFPATRTDISEASTGQLLLLGGGSTAAVMIHLVVQMWGVHRCGVRIRPNLNFRAEEISDIIGLTRQSIGVAVLGGLRLFIVYLLAATVEGGVVVVQFAYAFANLPIALVSRPLGTALLKRLAELTEARHRDTWWTEYRTGLLLNVALLLPAAIGMAAFAPAVARSIAFGALDTDGGIVLLTIGVMAASVIVLGEGCNIVALQAAYSRSRASAVTRGFVVRLGGAALAAGAALSTSGNARIAVLLIGVGVADMASSLYIHRRANSDGQRLDARRDLARMTMHAVVAIGPLAALASIAPDALLDPPYGFAALVGLGAVAAVLYLGRERSRAPLNTLVTLRRRADVAL